MHVLVLFFLVCVCVWRLTRDSLHCTKMKASIRNKQYPHLNSRQVVESCDQKAYPHLESIHHSYCTPYHCPHKCPAPPSHTTSCSSTNPQRHSATRNLYFSISTAGHSSSPLVLTWKTLSHVFMVRLIKTFCSHYSFSNHSCS